MAERTLEAFEAARRPRWVELAGIVDRGSSDPATLLRTLTLTRLVGSDLAWARRRFAGASVVEELETLLASARPLLARPPRRPLEVVADALVLVQGVVGRSRQALAAALVVLLAAVAAGGVWALLDETGAQDVLALGDRIPPGPDEVYPLVTGLPSGTPGSGASFSVLDAAELGAAALVGGALVGTGTVAATVLVGLRLGVGAVLALRGQQAARLVEGLGATGVALVAAVSLLAAGGFQVALGVAGRRQLAAAATDAAVLAALSLVPFTAAAVGYLVARSNELAGAISGAAALLLLGGGAVALAGRGPSALAGRTAAGLDDPRGRTRQTRGTASS